MINDDDDDVNNDDFQIRLNQLVGDWVRVPLTIQKVNVRVLKEEKMEVCYDLQGFIMIYNDEMMK